MRVLFDVTHPVHVHLFKNLISELLTAEHAVLVTACAKDVSLELLDRLGIDYVSTGSYGHGVLHKMLKVPQMDVELLMQARRFNPDVLVAEAPVRASHVGFVLRRPCVGLDDTEHSRLQRALWFPFVTRILTPTCYGLTLGSKHQRYLGYKELAYLHPRRFSPDAGVLTRLGLREDDAFAVVRFVSWEASHDIGQGGFSHQGKMHLVRELARLGRVFVSAEGNPPPELAEFTFRAPPDLIHHFLYYASVCVSEGATVASESAVLGTPAVYLNSLRLGYLEDQERRYGLVFNYHSRAEEALAISTACRLMGAGVPGKGEWRTRGGLLVNEHIDVTDFLMQEVLSVASLQAER